MISLSQNIFPSFKGNRKINIGNIIIFDATN